MRRREETYEHICMKMLKRSCIDGGRAGVFPRFVPASHVFSDALPAGGRRGSGAGRNPANHNVTPSFQMAISRKPFFSLQVSSSPEAAAMTYSTNASVSPCAMAS